MNLRDQFSIFWKHSKLSVFAILLSIALASLFSLCADNYIGLIAWILTFLSMVFEVVFLSFVLNVFSANLRVSKNEVKIEQKKLEEENHRIEKEKEVLSKSKENLDNLIQSVNEIVKTSGIKEMTEIIDQSGIKQAADIAKAHSTIIKNNPALKKQLEVVQEMSNSMNQAYPFFKNSDEDTEKLN